MHTVLTTLVYGGLKYVYMCIHDIVTSCGTMVHIASWWQMGTRSAAKKLGWNEKVRRIICCCDWAMGHFN